jgi:molybdopterin synthase sulfur carrier subunit
MKVKVRLFGDVSESVGSKHTVEIDEDTTVLNVTNLIQKKAGLTRGGYIGEFKVGGQEVAIMINGKNIALLDGVNTKLSDGDDVVVMPFVVGG